MWSAGWIWIASLSNSSCAFLRTQVTELFNTVAATNVNEDYQQDYSNSLVVRVSLLEKGEWKEVRLDDDIS